MSRRIFDTIFSDILGEAAGDGAAQVEMVLAEKELVMRATLDASQRWLLTDLFARDLLGFRPESLPVLHRALLVINDLAARAGDFSVAVDGRSMLVLTGRLPVEGLTAERYAGAVAGWLEQVELLRDTVAAIGMEHHSLTYSLPDEASAETLA